MHLSGSKLSVIGLALAIATGGIGFASAQDTEADASTEVGTTARLSPAQQREEAETIVGQAEGLASRITLMLDDARDDRDIIRLTCLNDKLTQVNAQLGTIRERRTSLNDALDAGNTDRANHDYTVLTVYAQRIDLLRMEAGQCVGSEMFETGTDATVDVTIDDESASIEEQTVLADAPVMPAPFIPAAASPTM